MEKYKIMEKSQHSLETMAHKSVVKGFLRISMHIHEADPVNSTYLDPSKLLVKSLPETNQVFIRMKVVLWTIN